MSFRRQFEVWNICTQLLVMVAYLDRLMKVVTKNDYGVLRIWHTLYLLHFSLIRSFDGVSLRIQSQYGKMWTRITPNTDNFYVAYITLKCYKISMDNSNRVWFLSLVLFPWASCLTITTILVDERINLCKSCIFPCFRVRFRGSHLQVFQEKVFFKNCAKLTNPFLAKLPLAG